MNWRKRVETQNLSKFGQTVAQFRFHVSHKLLSFLQFWECRRFILLYIGGIWMVRVEIQTMIQELLLKNH